MSRHEVPVAATGLLRAFAEATLISPVDFHLARRMAALCRESDPRVELAFALATRELRLGSVCLDLRRAHELSPEAGIDDGVAEGLDVDLPWPETDAWLAAVAASPAVAGEQGASRPFRLVGSWLYLDRYWLEERSVEASLRRRAGIELPRIDDARLARATAPLPSRRRDELQDAAVTAALRNATTVITGGPGTGKTTTVARILGGLADEEQPPLVALAAPTGKASTRLASAVAESLPEGAAGLRLRSYTLHKLLGVVPGRAHRTHGSHNLLPHDVVIVDETSMVSLTMMSWLLEAVSRRTRLILIGDPQQLASVEAGAVLADIANSPDLVTSVSGDALVELRSNFRSNDEITNLADAIQVGDADAVVALLAGGTSCTLQDYTGSEPLTGYRILRADLHATADAVRAAALRGDGDVANAALGGHRLLCAHREGPFGVGHWSRAARGWLSEQFEDYAQGAGAWPGQPLLITRNSDMAANGDTAVVVRRQGRLLAAVDRARGTLLVDPVLLDDATDLHAMTIHKSQGSQFDVVSVILPPLGSPLLTRELLYTAITRARTSVRLYGTEAALRTAVETPARRASGLGRQTGNA